MKRISLLSVAVLTLSFLHAQSITGTWSGSLDIMGNRLPIVFHIAMNDSAFITKMDSPAQNAFGLPTSKTTFSDDRLEIVASGLGIFYQGKLEGDSISGTFNQGGIPFPLTLKQSEEPIMNRPQEPRPPFDYKIEEVKFSNKKDKINLAGTITLPDSVGKLPAVILIAGSGPNDRDETIFGHKPFWVIADFLTRNGYVVLRYDKRGVGKSEGSYATATTENFAADAQSAFDYLKTRNEVDKSVIGLIGHSEGGVIAPMVASQNRDVKFIVLMAAMGIKGINLILDQNESAMVAQKMEEANIVNLQRINRKMFESLSGWKGTENDKTLLRDQLTLLWDKMPILSRMKTNKEQFIRSNFNAMITPWYRGILAINPSEFLQMVKCPVLAINGEKDSQVLYFKNISAIRSALESGGNNRFATKTYPNLNHLFQECQTGEVDEYGQIEQTISPQVLSDILEWMQSPPEFTGQGGAE